jgi:hypothetical protein
MKRPVFHIPLKISRRCCNLILLKRIVFWAVLSNAVEIPYSWKILDGLKEYQVLKKAASPVVSVLSVKRQSCVCG